MAWKFIVRFAFEKLSVLLFPTELFDLERAHPLPSHSHHVPSSRFPMMKNRRQLCLIDLMCFVLFVQDEIELHSEVRALLSEKGGTSKGKKGSSQRKRLPAVLLAKIILQKLKTPKFRNFVRFYGILSCVIVLILLFARLTEFFGKSCNLYRRSICVFFGAKFCFDHRNCTGVL